VDAAIVHLQPLPHQDIPYPLLEDILRFFFTRKRKSSSHILNLLQSKLKLTEPIYTEIPSNARPENITNEQFVALANTLQSAGVKNLP
jgi:dimethyladenosine transferase 1